MRIVKYAKSHDIHKEFSMVPTKDWFDLWCDYPAMKTCEWYKGMEKKRKMKGLNAARTYIETSKESTKPQWYFSNVKSCPNITNFLSHCMVVKAATDFDFAVASQAMVRGEREPFMKAVSADDHVHVAPPHPRVQFTSTKSNLFKDKLNVKIDTDVVLFCDKDIKPVFMQPVYHNPNAPWTVLPGQFYNPQNTYANIIFNAVVDEGVSDFSVKAGDALFYVYFGERVKMVPIESYTESKLRQKFYRHIRTVRDVLGR